MNEIRVPSDAYYGDFQHTKKKIKCGDVIVKSIHKVIVLQQNNLGLNNDVGIHVKRIPELINALERMMLEVLDGQAGSGG